MNGGLTLTSLHGQAHGFHAARGGEQENRGTYRGRINGDDDMQVVLNTFEHRTSLTISLTMPFTISSTIDHIMVSMASMVDMVNMFCTVNIVNDTLLTT